MPVYEWQPINPPDYTLPNTMAGLAFAVGAFAGVVFVDNDPPESTWTIIETDGD